MHTNYHRKKEKDKEESYRSITPSFNYKYEFKTNKIRLHGPSYFLTFFYSIIQAYQKIPYFWFTILIILDFYYDSTPVSLKSCTLAPLILLLISSYCINLRHTYSRHHHDSEKNSTYCQVLTDMSFTSKKISEVQVGDFVLLQDKDLIPADIVLLAVDSHESVCFSDMSVIVGGQDLIKKYPVKETQNFISQDGYDAANLFKHVEVVKVSQPNGSFKNFSGKIKMKGNPKAIRIGLDNFLFRESVLIACNWAVGMVVYAGMDTKVWINAKKDDLFKVSKLSARVNWILCSALAGYFVLAFGMFGLGFLYEVGRWDEQLVHFLFLFHKTVPVSFYLAFELSKVLQMLVINVSKSEIQIKNPKIFENLGRVEFILAGKRGVLTEDESKVQACLLNRRVFLSGLSGLCPQPKLESRPSDKARSNDLFLKEEDNPSRYDGEFLSLEDLRAELNSQTGSPPFSKDEESDLWVFLLALMTCNHFNNDLRIKKFCQDEEILLNLGQSLGVHLVHRSINSAVISFQQAEHKFDILASHGIYSQHKVNKILIKSRNKAEAFLIVKGKLDQMQELLDNLEENMALDESVHVPILQNLQKIIFAYRVLGEEELTKFVFDYKNARFSPVNQDGRIASVFEKYEKNLKLLAVAGIENPIKPGVNQAISQLASAGIRTWIVTGDTEESALLTGAATGIYDASTRIARFSKLFSAAEFLQMMKVIESRELFHLETKEIALHSQHSGSMGRVRSELNFIPRDSFSNSSPLISQITMKLSSKKKNAPNLPGVPNVASASSVLPDDSQPGKKLNLDYLNFIISIDSTALEYVFSSIEIRRKFVELLCAARSVFLHSMLPDHKIKLVRLLKHNLAFDPVVLGLGDGNTNTGMLGQADIGISDQSAGDDLLYTRDAQIGSFERFAKLVIEFGHWAEVRASKVLLLGLFKSLLLVVVLLGYQGACQVSAFSMIDYDLIVLYDLAVSLGPLVLVGTFFQDAQGQQGQQAENVQVYAQGFDNWGFASGKILWVAAEALADGIVIVVSLVLGVGETVNGEGRTETSDLFGVFGFMAVCNCFLVKVCYDNWRQRFINLAIAGFILATEILFVCLTLNGTITQYTISDAEFLNQGRLFFILFMTPLINLEICVIIDLVSSGIKTRFIKSRLEQYSSGIEKCFVDNNDLVQDEGVDEIDELIYDVRFKSKFTENNFQMDLMPTIKHIFKVFTVISLIVAWIFYVIRMKIDSGTLEFSYLTVIPGIILFFHTVLMFYKGIDWKYFICVTFATSAFLLSVSTIDQSVMAAYSYLILSFVFCVAFNFRFIVTLLQSILSLLLFTICTFVDRSLQTRSSYVQTSLSSTSSMCGYTCLIVLISYNLSIQYRKDFTRLNQIKAEARTYKNILSYLLPEFVRKRVKEGERYIAEDKGTVSVIFLDMCNFDDIVMIYSPQELTSFLDDVFGRIDKLCESIGVTKIETVGKTYLACAGLKDSEAKMDPGLTSVPHARRVIELGLAVLREIKKITLKDGNQLMFKVGISSGPVTAGVVGFHKPQFSLVGDTVNTASRMSSTLAEPNAIQITLQTFAIVGDKRGLSFEDHQVEVKGKGLMETKKVSLPQEYVEFDENHITVPSFVLSSFVGGSNAKVSSCKSDTMNNLINDQDNETPDAVRNNRDSKYVNQMITLDFRENTVELEFREKYLDGCSSVIYYGLVVNIGISSILIVLEIFFIIFGLKYSSKYRLGTFLIDLGLGSLLLISFKKFYKQLFFGYLMSCLYSIDFFAGFIFSFLHYYPAPFYFELLGLRYLSVNYCSGLFFNRLIIPNIINFSLWIILSAMQGGYPYLYTSISFWVFIVLTCKYLYELKIRNMSVLVENATKEKEKTEELLTNMLPHQALKELKEENFLTDRISYVTLMYADIVGFTAWSSVRQPKEVVGKLSQLFTTFDKLCLKHNVYKVHTIGDCYVVLGYQSDRNRNPAKEALNVLNFALSLVHVIEESNTDPSYRLSMRVGIHTGEVIGGITGTNIVRYDIYGPDVLIANKMESNGEAGKVVLSEVTKEMIEDCSPESFEFKYLKEIPITVLKRSIKIFQAVSTDPEFNPKL